MTPVLLGQQTPRLQLAPPALFNAGDDAIEFARRIGVPLDPWQKLGLRNGMGCTHGGIWAAFEVCVICQRQNGKGSITDVLELYALFILGLPVIIHSAHRLDTSRKAFRVVKGIIERNPDLARRCKPINDSDEHIETIGGGRLEFRTRTRSGGRGLTCNLLVLDEALELTSEQIAAIVPTLAAVPGAQIWYTSTVPESADQHLCQVRKQALAGAPRLAYCEWGVDKGVDLGDPIAHAQANPAYGIRLMPERLADLRRILGDAKFATECLGIWPDVKAGAVLDIKVWKAPPVCDPQSRRSGDVTLMLDISPLRDHATIGLFGLREDGLEHVQVVDYRPGVDWIPGRAAEWNEALDPLCWVIDERNGAHAMLDDLSGAGIRPPADAAEPRRGDLLILDTRAAADATAQFIDAYRGGVLRYPGGPEQKVLEDAVENAKTRPIGDAGQIAWGRKVSEVNIGPLVTVTGARYGFYTWVGLIRDDYDILAGIPAVDGQCPYCDAWSLDGPIDHYVDCVTLRTEVPAGA